MALRSALFLRGEVLRDSQASHEKVSVMATNSISDCFRNKLNPIKRSSLAWKANNTSFLERGERSFSLNKLDQCCECCWLCWLGHTRLEFQLRSNVLFSKNKNIVSQRTNGFLVLDFLLNSPNFSALLSNLLFNCVHLLCYSRELLLQVLLQSILQSTQSLLNFCALNSNLFIYLGNKLIHMRGGEHLWHLVRHDSVRCVWSAHAMYSLPKKEICTNKKLLL